MPTLSPIVCHGSRDVSRNVSIINHQHRQPHPRFIPNQSTNERRKRIHGKDCCEIIFHRFNFTLIFRCAERSSAQHFSNKIPVIFQPFIVLNFEICINKMLNTKKLQL